MNDQIQNNEPYDRHEARRQRREERREARGAPAGGTWIVGIILIVLGGMFLMQNMGSFSFPLTNWWALFILIPALGSLERAYRSYTNAGNQFTAFVLNSAFVGVILLIVTGLLLFNLSWTYYGPLLLILVGLGVLLGSFFSSKE